jgi:hypothetical protein
MGGASVEVVEEGPNVERAWGGRSLETSWGRSLCRRVRRWAVSRRRGLGRPRSAEGGGVGVAPRIAPRL